MNGPGVLWRIDERNVSSHFSGCYVTIGSPNLYRGQYFIYRQADCPLNTTDIIRQ